jgi:hypothetical protein
VVTLTGSSGQQTDGSWNTRTNDGCTIDGSTSCSFSLSRIRKNVGSVTYTDKDPSLGSVTITKP